jgi:hypothetical protein
MRGHYSFLRTTGGRSYFARVWVEVDPGGETLDVEDALPERVDPDTGEVNRQSAPGWVAAALEGIQATLAHARQAGILTKGCRVVLEKVVGSVVDTREDTVRCAAALAVWEAFGSPACAPEAEFDGQNWKLVFPASVGIPVQGLSR